LVEFGCLSPPDSVSSSYSFTPTCLQLSHHPSLQPFNHSESLLVNFNNLFVINPPLRLPFCASLPPFRPFDNLQTQNLILLLLTLYTYYTATIPCSPSNHPFHESGYLDHHIRLFLASPGPCTLLCPRDLVSATLDPWSRPSVIRLQTGS